MQVLVIDNYDSFTYNLVHMTEALGVDCIVVRNDQLDLDRMEAYQKIMISPGPGLPANAGKTMEVLQRFSSSKSILGVCLGHQAIGEFCGAQLANLPEVFHGVATRIQIEDKKTLFAGMPDQIEVGRYHSWVIDPATLGPELLITARDTHGQIMAVRHKTLDLEGVQFHPESIMTENGLLLLKNWLSS